MNIELLKDLCSTPAPSSGESAVAEIIINELKDFVDEIETDTLGNVIAHKKGGGKRLMLTAHMDQPGMMITFVDENGFLRFSCIGELKFHQLLGRRVLFQNGLSGVIGCEKTPDQRKAALNNLYIDVGIGKRSDAAGVVEIGDMCVFAGETVVDDFKILSPGLQRLGCFTLIESLKTAADFKNDLYFVFTAQREVLMTGAKTSAYTTNPDCCVAFDLTPASDIPSTEVPKLPVKAGLGAAIKVKDSSVVCSPQMIRFLEGLADKNRIPYQFEIADGFKSEASVIHVSRGGVPTSGISVPVRYAGTGNQLCFISDVEMSIKLGAKVIESEIL